MTDFIEQAARWLSDDDTAYADEPTAARRAAGAMLSSAIAEIERLRAENARLEKILTSAEFFDALRERVMAQTSESRAYLAKYGD